MKKQKKTSLFGTRRFRSGGYAVLVSLVAVLVVVAVNLFVGQLPATATKLDTTQQKLFTFTDQTRQQLAALTEPVTLTLIAEKGQEDETTLSLLDRYKALSDKITVNTVDPVVQPKFTATYTKNDVAAGSVIVESAKRNKVVMQDVIYQYDYSNYYSTGSYDVSFAGESALTSAIDYVVSDNLPVVYQLQGHGETQLTGTVKTAVANANLTVKDLSLLSLAAVPEDCSALLIYAPTADLGSEEVDKVIAYLDQGGHLLLLTDYATDARPNLTRLVNNYGVDFANGIVLEGDANQYVRNYQHYLLPKIGAHSITQPLIDGKLYALMPSAHGIVKLANYRSTLTVTDLLSTTGKAYLRLDPNASTSMERQDSDMAGPFDIGVAVTETVADGQTRVVWFSTSQFLSDQVDQMVSGANTDLLVDSLNWMCERENSISISAKELSQAALTVPSGTASWLGGLLAAVLPLAVLAVGIVVVVKRRKR